MFLLPFIIVNKKRNLHIVNLRWLLQSVSNAWVIKAFWATAQVPIEVTVQLVHKQGTTLCRRHDLIVPRSCRRYLLLMLIGLGCAVGCAVVPSYFSAAGCMFKNFRAITVIIIPIANCWTVCYKYMQVHLNSCMVFRTSCSIANYIHFGPWSLRSLVISVFFKGPKWPRTELTKDRSAATTSALETDLSIIWSY